ncbi:hypothetical protein MP638_002321 [Amoeboaphelidium occidentale]|nr:hypothetical protein MP638_002321 [Amoeboaphelidium occidentale]
MDLVKRISTLRGMPNLANFNSVIQYNELSTETQQKLRYFLDQVASGNEVRSTDSTRSPGSNEAVELLTQYGFLHETEDGILQFASQMHHNVWLQSNRTDPDPGLLVDPLKTDFLIQSIKRMRASKLVEFAGANTNDIVRERKLQMELYRATCTCAPPDTVITPEWRVSSTNGFIDMRISNAKVNWFWEFLVNGDRAEEHSSRFMLGGKYSPVLTPGTKHVLIDFRQKTRLRIRRNEFIYVSFTEDYSECTVSGLPDGDRKITLEK